MKYHFKVHKESDGYWAEGLELKGCRTQGDTLEELRGNMDEALNLYLSEIEDSSILFKTPRVKYSGKGIVAVEVNPSVALAMEIRQARIKMGKTQKEMMAFLKLKTLSNYQRLENPKTANPKFKTLVTLAKQIPGLQIGKIFESY